MKQINIREALLELDRKTDARYDLTTLYEACKLDDDDKQKLVKYIDAYDHPATINKFLSSKCDAITEALGDDDVSDMKLIDEINDGGHRTLWNLMDKFEDEDLQLKELKEDVDPEVLEGRLDNIDYAMNHYAKDSFFIDDVQGSGTEYKVTYNGVTVDVTFDTEWEELTYYINGKGPYCHSSYEYIVSDIMNFVDYNHLGQSDDEVDESLTEGVDTSNLEPQIKEVVTAVMQENGYEADEIEAYTAVEIKDTVDDMVQVEVRAELGYDDLMELCDKLNPIVAALDHFAYFEPVTSGIARAFIRNDQSQDIVDEDAVNQWTNKIYDCASMEDLRQVYRIFKDHIDNQQYTDGTVDAVLDVIHKKADMLNESLIRRTPHENKAELDEALPPWKSVSNSYGKLVRSADTIISKNKDGILSDDTAVDILDRGTNAIDIALAKNESLTEDAKEEYFVGDDETGRIYYNEKDAQAAFDSLKKSGIANPVKMKVTDMRESITEDYNKGEWVEVNLNTKKNGTPNIIPVKVEKELYHGRTFLGWAWGERQHEYPMSAIVKKIDMDDTDAIIRKYTPSGYMSEKLTLNESDDTDILYDMEDWDEDNTTVTAGNQFIEDGYTWMWFKQCGDTVHLDFDNWAVWWAYRREDEDDEDSAAISGFFVVDTDTGFIDWGPCDTVKEAQEFLQSKVNDWENDGIDESKIVKESLDIDDAYNKVMDKFGDVRTGINDDYDTVYTGIELAINDLNNESNKLKLFNCTNSKEVRQFLKTLINNLTETFEDYPNVASGYHDVMNYLSRSLTESKSIKEDTNDWSLGLGTRFVFGWGGTDNEVICYTRDYHYDRNDDKFTLEAWLQLDTEELIVNRVSRYLKKVPATDMDLKAAGVSRERLIQAMKNFANKDVYESKSIKEGYRGDDGLDDILSWLQDHEQAWDDFCVRFEDVEDEDLTQDMVVDWISGYEQLYDDFLDYFGEDEFLDESKSIKEDVNSNLEAVANKLFNSLKEYGANKITKYVDVYQIYFNNSEDDSDATLIHYDIQSEGFKEVTQHGDEPNVTEYVNEDGTVCAKLLIYADAITVEVSAEDASQYMNVDESLKEGVEKYIIIAKEDGLNLYYNATDDNFGTDMKAATQYSERAVALDDYKAVKDRYPTAYIRSTYDIPLLNKPSKKEGFEEDEWDDDELASIYGGDTKYDMPDGVETPEETEARLAKENGR